MKLRLGEQQSYALVLSLGVCLLAAVVWASLLGVDRARMDAADVDRSQAILKQLVEMLAVSTDAETGERGYVITGTPDYLKPFEAALARHQDVYRGLAELTSDSPTQQRKLQQLYPLIEARLAQAQRVIELRRQSGFTAAQREVTDGRGKALQDRIRELVAAMQINERQLLSQRTEASKRADRTVRIVVALGSIFAALIFGFALAFLTRDLRRRTRALESGRIELQQDIERRLRAEMLLVGQNEVLEHIAAGSPLATTLECLVRVIEAQSENTICSILRVDEQKEYLRHAVAPGLPAEYVRAIDGLKIGPQAGSCGAAAWRREQVIVDDIARDPLWRDYREIALAHGLRACWATPIFSPSGELFGTFACYCRAPRQPDELQQRLIRTAVHLAAVCFSREREGRLLREERQRLELAIGAGNVGLWDWNIVTNHVYFSPEWKRQIGYAADEIRDDFEEWRWRVHPEDIDRALQQVQAYVAAPWPDYRIEFRMRHKDGSYRWIFAQAAIVGNGEGGPKRMLGCHIDMTEHMRAEQALRESETRLRTLFAQASDGIFILDGKNRFLDANARGIEMLGYTRETVLQKSLADVLDAVELPRLASETHRIMNGMPSFGEWQYRCADGTVFCGEVSACQLDAASYMVILRDVTLRKSAERELAGQAERLRQLSRQLVEAEAAEQRRLARELHDRVGQNLSSLMMNLVMLGSSLPVDVPDTLLSRLTDSRLLLERTIDEVRTVMAELRPVELDDFGFVKALGFYAEQAGQRAGFAVTLRDDMNGVQLPVGIETALYRIGQEAITNIAKHAGANRVNVRMAIDPGGFMLEITDDGIGIDPGALGGGRGLRGIRERLDLLGGGMCEIGPAPLPGGGTRFMVRISGMAEASAAAAERN